MRLAFTTLITIVCASPMFAQDQEPLVTPLIPMSVSFGALIDDGYDLIAIDFNGRAWLEDGTNKLVICELSGNSSDEIMSVCKQVGK